MSQPKEEICHRPVSLPDMQNHPCVYGIRGGIFIILVVVSSLLPQSWVWASISVTGTVIAPDTTERFTPWLSCCSFPKQERDETSFFDSCWKNPTKSSWLYLEY